MSRKEVLDPVTMEDFMQVCLPPRQLPAMRTGVDTSCYSSQNADVWNQSSLGHAQALQRINSSVSKDDVRRHEEWRDEFGSV